MKVSGRRKRLPHLTQPLVPILQAWAGLWWGRRFLACPVQSY